LTTPTGSGPFQPGAWLEAVRVVATDLTDSYRRGMAGVLDHALKVADPFHVVRVAQRCLDSIRRRVQREHLGHRGRSGDPLNLATVLLGRATQACLADEVPEIQSLGRTLRKWWTEILNHHRTSASNGPTEAMNLCVKKVKRAGHGFRCFDPYRLRVLLHAGGCDWSRYTTPTRPIRTRSPH
jgi:transposase